MLYDVIVIGSGQAGLAAGYYLKKTNLSFVILDKAQRVGDSWRNRYDSLQLFSPRASDALPGMKMEGEQNGYPAKDEVADYLGLYASTLTLPIELSRKVETLEKDAKGFMLRTNKKEDFFSKNIIIATGPFTVPFIPNLPGKLSQSVVQIHSSAYRNSSQLKKGITVVAGAGNSGVQIALEIGKLFPTFLACSKKPKLVPKNIFGKSIYWWSEKLGILYIILHSPKESFIGKFLKKHYVNPVVGKELEEALKKHSIQLRKKVVRLEGKNVIFSDGASLEVKNIIWATGFKNDYSWIRIPDAFNTKGHVIHTNGVSSVAGLYFLGLEWLSSKVSSELLGVGKDAKYVVDRIYKIKD